MCKEDTKRQHLKKLIKISIYKYCSCNFLKSGTFQFMESSAVTPQLILLTIVGTQCRHLEFGSQL